LGAVGADGRLVGVISRTDLIRVSRLRAALAGGTRLMSFGHQRVRDRLTPAVIVVDRDATLRHAARQMVTARVHQIAVVEAGRMVGMLSVGDIIAAVAEEKIDLPLASCMTLPVITVDASDSLANAIDRLIESRVHGLVVTESTWPVGIFGQNEALDAAGLDPHHRVEEAMSCAMLCLPARTPLWRAAELAVDTGAQRILAIVNRELRGIATGLDLARVAAGLD
jgi:CBS domain-containing protein